MNQLVAVDWVVVAVYCLVTLALGLWVSFRGASESTDSYFLSGRSLPWWIAGASMAASAFSIDTPIYVASLTRKEGVSGNWEWWFMGVSGILGATIMARYWRRAGITTDLELITLRYTGRAAKLLRGARAVFFGAIFNPLAMAVVLTAVIKVFGVVAPGLVHADQGGWPTAGGWGVLIAVVGVAVFYSVLSGFMGVVLTDLIQFVVSMLGALVMAWYAVSMAGGWEALVTHPAVVEKSTFLPAFDPWNDTATKLCVFLGVMWWTFVNADGGGKYIQRMASCVDEAAAEKATWFSTLTFVALRSWPWILVALAGLIIFPGQTDAETIYPRIMLRLPDGLRGLVFASLIAAFMSTLDTMLNWGASYLVNDLIEPYAWPGQSEKTYVRLAQWLALPTLGLAALFFFALNPPPAFAGAASKGIEVTKTLRSVILVSSGLGAIYLLRWFWYRLTAWAEVAAMIVAPSAAWALSLWAEPLVKAGELTGGGAYALKALGVSALTLLSAVVISFLGPQNEPSQLRAFVERVRPAGFWGPYRRPGPALWPWLLLRFVGGNALLFGATFAAGSLVLGRGLGLLSANALVAVLGFGLDRWGARRLEELAPAPPLGAANPEPATAPAEPPAEDDSSPEDKISSASPAG